MTFSEFENELLAKKPKLLKAVIMRTISCIKASACDFWELLKEITYIFIHFLLNILCLVFFPVTYVIARIVRFKRLRETKLRETK